MRTRMRHNDAADIARDAADRAATLATEQARKETDLAVARALKDAAVDREIEQHSEHLKEINGSQRSMATSLTSLDAALKKIVANWERQSAVNDALAKTVRDATARRLSRLTIILTVLGVAAAYLTIFAVVVTGLHV